MIQEYRLSSEEETTLKSVARVFAYVEEFSCSPPTLVMFLLTLSELAVYLYTIFTVTDFKERIHFIPNHYVLGKKKILEKIYIFLNI